MIKSKALRQLLLSSAALTLPCLAYAQDSNVVQLDTLVVTSDREVQTNTATPVTVIDEAEIEERQASTVAELLDSVPGVNLVNGSTPGGSAINIRGFGAWSGTYGNDQTVQIIVDGASTGGEELYRIGTQLYTDPALYKQAEVIRGSVGTFEYGSGAIGGMVRFETKDASDFTHGEPGVAGRQYLGYNANGDGFVTSTTLAMQPTENAEFLFNFTYRDQGDYQDGAGNTLENTGFSTPSYLAKGKVYFGDSREHSLTFSYSDTQSEEKDVPYDQFSGATGYFGNVDRDIHSKTAVLKYNFDAVDNDLLDVDVILSRADQDIQMSSTSGSTSGLLNAHHSYVTTKLTAKNTMEFVTGTASHNLRVGAEYVFKDRLDASSAPGGDDKRYALFLVDDIKFGGFTFSPALRYEDQHIDGTEYGYGTYDNDALMGGLSLRYEFENGFAVFGSYAHTEGMPILDDLSNAAYMSQSQKATTYEAGVSYDATGLFSTGDKLAIKINGYHTDVYDITAYSRVTDVEVEGVEIEASYAHENGYYGDLNASFANGYNRTDDATSDYWAQQPADQLRLGLGKRFENGASVKWETVYNLKMDRADDPTASSVIHNISAAYAPHSGIFEGTDFRIGVENVFDREYTPHLATRAAPGRTLKLSIGKNF